jgi:pyruvate/2-oxoacid:ferredoxin oxidoreductase alpha subunit
MVNTISAAAPRIRALDANEAVAEVAYRAGLVLVSATPV